MNKKIIVGAVVIIALSTLALLFLKPSLNSGPSTVSVASADGKFKLEIPLSALSENSLVPEISVARISTEDWRGDPVIIYKLSPDGLTFKEPVTFTATVEIEPGDVPIGLHVDGTAGDITAIENHQAVLDYAQGVATITGTINHFSSILLIKSGVFATIDRGSSSYTRVGENREISVSISAIKDDGSPADKINDDVTAIYTRVGLTTMKGDLTARTDTITPAQIQDVVPRAVLVPGGGAIRGRGVFSCVKDGYANQSFDFYIYATVETEFVGKSIIDALGRTFLGRNTKVSIEDYVYRLYSEGYSCLGGSSDPGQQIPTTTNEPTTAGPQDNTGTDEKIKVCGLPGGEPCPKR